MGPTALHVSGRLWGVPRRRCGADGQQEQSGRQKENELRVSVFHSWLDMCDEQTYLYIFLTWPVNDWKETVSGEEFGV